MYFLAYFHLQYRKYPYNGARGDDIDSIRRYVVCILSPGLARNPANKSSKIRFNTSRVFKGLRAFVAAPAMAIAA